MILLRGYDQAKYAHEISQGIIGFRDVLTTLLYHEKNGYKLSDYYEEYLIQAVNRFDFENIDFCNVSKETSQQLRLIFNPFIPHFYASYFHILNENSENWLENFSDGSHFIYAIPKLQQRDGIDETLYGPNMIGSQMIYLPQDGKINTPDRLIQKAGMLALIQNELDTSTAYGGTPFGADMYLVGIMSAICLELFARRCGGEYDESENEFRILYKKPTPYRKYSGCFEAIEPRIFQLTIDNLPYAGRIIRGAEDTPFFQRIGYNMALRTDHVLANESLTTLKDVIDAKRNYTIHSDFLPVNVSPIFRKYGYIGDAEQCRAFIRKNLKRAST